MLRCIRCIVCWVIILHLLPALHRLPMPKVVVALVPHAALGVVVRCFAVRLVVAFRGELEVEVMLAPVMVPMPMVLAPVMLAPVMVMVLVVLVVALGHVVVIALALLVALACHSALSPPPLVLVVLGPVGLLGAWGRGSLNTSICSVKIHCPTM